VRRIGTRPQRTLARPAEVRGVGFVTGAAVRVRFLPAPANAGVVFVRADLPGRPVTPARADRVTATARRTTLGGAVSGVTLVEHALAALAGLRIDNCRVEVGGPELPGLDGSSQGFVDALTSSGVVSQSAGRPVYAAAEPVVVSHGGATVGLHPPDRDTDVSLRATYTLDYGAGSPIPPQAHTLDVTPGAFAREVAGCRTFLLEAEAAALRAQGVGTHLTAADLLMFGPRGPVGNRVRFADEPARHKVLDLVGDLALCGFDLAGHVVAYRSGHALNVELAKALVAGVNATAPQRRAA
jgi:UDP-3-O-acyl N-acetylglucosamine deacetylase